VYGLAFGHWNSEYERIYRQIAPQVEDLAGTRVPLRHIQEARSGRQERMIYEFEQLRFARLCAHLRRREPDDRVAYSILIYHVSDDELRSAIGPQE
jgi:hypothetical protein